MATYINSTPSMGDTTLPTNAGALIRGEEWGIDNILANCIVQTENITESRMSDVTQDQKGSTVSILDYDKMWELNLTVIGDSDKMPIIGDESAFSVGDTTFSYAGKKWKLESVTYNGSYNGKKTFSLSARRYLHFPSQD